MLYVILLQCDVTVVAFSFLSLVLNQYISSGVSTAVGKHSHATALAAPSSDEHALPVQCGRATPTHYRTLAKIGAQIDNGGN